MQDTKVQMRFVWLGSTTGSFMQYRVCRENGWGSSWQNTLYLAWIDWRRRLKSRNA